MVATNRLVWLWLVTGQALRRGDLDLVDRHLPELRATALASEEPQRILPMAGVAMPRAVLAQDLGEVRNLADLVIELRATNFSSSPSTLAIPRSLAAIGEHARLEVLLRIFTDWTEGTSGVVATAVRGLLASLEGKPGEAARLLVSVEEELRALGRHYDAACVALDVARVLDESGDAAAAQTARTRATALLDPLACVNPY